MNGGSPEPLKRAVPGIWVFLALALCQSVSANVLTESLQWQATTVELGLARLKDQFLDISIRQDVEYVGAVFRTAEGSIRFTQGRGRPGQDQVTFRIRAPGDARLIGFWHTHGADGFARTVFSRTDAELVRVYGLPFYLITPDGEIRVLRPEHVAPDMGTRLAGLPRGAHPGERLFTGQARACGDVMEV